MRPESALGLRSRTCARPALSPDERRSGRTRLTRHDASDGVRHAEIRRAFGNFGPHRAGERVAEQRRGHLSVVRPVQRPQWRHELRLRDVRAVPGDRIGHRRLLLGQSVVWAARAAAAHPQAAADLRIGRPRSRREETGREGLPRGRSSFSSRRRRSKPSSPHGRLTAMRLPDREQLVRMGERGGRT
jgi:hypothetical protein